MLIVPQIPKIGNHKAKEEVKGKFLTSLVFSVISAKGLAILQVNVKQERITKRLKKLLSLCNRKMMKTMSY